MEQLINRSISTLNVLYPQGGHTKQDILQMMNILLLDDTLKSIRLMNHHNNEKTDKLIDKIDYIGYGD